MTDSPTPSQAKPSLLESIANRRMLVCIACGFTSGLPLYILYQLIPAWLRDQGIDRTTIGLFSLVGFPYTWKFIWSALMDLPLPGPLGRRRSWALLCQVCLMLTLAALALFDPKTSLNEIVWVVALVAFFSASQDIVLDAYRRELLPDHELGIGNSYYVNAYRLSSLVPGSLALILADRLPWSTVHLIVAAFMLVGIITTLLMPEHSTADASHASSKLGIGRLWEPLAEFFVSRGTRHALLLLVFMLLYKLGDSMATALATPFYLDMGFSKTEIGTIAKSASLWSSITGGVIGGILMVKIGINRALWVFGVVQLASIFGFALLSEVGHHIPTLFLVVSFEYLGVGLGTAAFVAFIARNTDRRYTATQFALLTSLTGVPRTFANASTGWLIDQMGYTPFFLLCGAIALPGMILLRWVAPWGPDPEPNEA